jgi:HemK-related putative methylase
MPVCKPREISPRLIMNYPKPIRNFWRRCRRLYFKVFQQKHYNRKHTELIGKKEFTILPDVLSPKFMLGGEIFATSLNSNWIPPSSKVLDMGTGSGVCAIFAAQWAKKVVAVDINPFAVACANLNISKHHLGDRVHAKKSDLFEALESQKFDVVLFNPPFFIGTPEDDLDKAWRSTDVAERFAGQLGDHLTPDGYALLLLSEQGAPEHFIRQLTTQGFEVELVKRRDIISEIFSFYKVSKTQNLSL